MKFLMAAIVSLAALSSSASVLKNGSIAKEKEGVKIPHSVTLTLNGEETTLQLVGSGVRKKSFLNVKVYLVEIFADNRDAFVPKREQALESIDKSQKVAVRATFLRNVDAETIMNAFSDGFGVNNIDTQKDQSIKAFLASVANGGDGDQGKNLNFILTKNSDGSEMLVYEDSKGKATTINGSAGFSKKVLSLWLGKMVDGKAQDMQNEILSGK